MLVAHSLNSGLDFVFVVINIYQMLIFEKYILLIRGVVKLVSSWLPVLFQFAAFSAC
jgi:energy-coupling factor transporter transmembrane protein EcfT